MLVCLYPYPFWYKHLQRATPSFDPPTLNQQSSIVRCPKTAERGMARQFSDRFSRPSSAADWPRRGPASAARPLGVHHMLNIFGTNCVMRSSSAADWPQGGSAKAARPPYNTTSVFTHFRAHASEPTVNCSHIVPTVNRSHALCRFVLSSLALSLLLQCHCAGCVST